MGYHEYCGGLSLSNCGGCGVTWWAIMSIVEGYH